ncbi:MAG: hypothetical protein AAFR38_06475 [Planctomycetota bacterium]
MKTLWDMLVPKPKKPARLRRAARAKPRTRVGPMAAKYEAVTRLMLDRYGVRVRKWRTSMSGVAWEVRGVGADGAMRVARYIEAPRPKGPMSAAVFLHEIGHHAIGVGAVKPRCLEELRAWQFSLAAMEEHGLNVTDGVRKRVELSMRYAVDKAVRRGMKRLPAELKRYR